MNATATKCSCSCNAEAGPPALVYPCSGSADVGEIADRAARRLDAEDKAWMSCLAGIGGRVSGLMANAAAAPVLIAIDGCPHDCAKKTLQLAGFSHVRHVRVTDLGFTKGKTPVTAGTVATVTRQAAALLN
ncbi:MAG TPA: zinc-binding protein [Verrucomicrobiales bacterium]|nr:zinc-binding protein [Verrucomicrobiales bacterium]